MMLITLRENRRRPDIEARMSYAKRELELRETADLLSRVGNPAAIDYYVAANKLRRLLERES